MYTRINPDDQEAVIWLQRVLAKLLGSMGSFVEIGRLNAPTNKNIRLYQQKFGLRINGEADEATLQHIKQQLEERGLTIS